MPEIVTGGITARSSDSLCTVVAKSVGAAADAAAEDVTAGGTFPALQPIASAITVNIII